MVHHGLGYRKADGILVNSFDALESGAAKVFAQKEPGRPPVYTIGPLIRGPKKEEGAECLKWLDEQPKGSVLFVSLGSVGTLTATQWAELALGLEASGQRFLFVVRSPSDTDINDAYIKVGSTDDPLVYLPEGFAGRTKGVGLVVPWWAPQIEVLAHRATGGFLSHCGWNSTLESVVNGVPMIAWPLFAEQKQNAVMLVEGEKVALRLAAAEGGMVTREEVARVVKELMQGEEGKKVRGRVRELQEAAAKALADDGSSDRAIAEVATRWKNSTSSTVAQ
jgi:hydroquinone glucosyltransferase